MARPRAQTPIIVVSFVLLFAIGVSGWVVSFLSVDRGPSPPLSDAGPRLSLYGIVVDLSAAVARLDVLSVEAADGVRRSFLSAISELESVDPGNSEELVRRFDDLLITGFERSRDLADLSQDAEASRNDIIAATADLDRVVTALREAVESVEPPVQEARAFLDRFPPINMAGFALVLVGLAVVLVVPARVHRNLVTLTRAGGWKAEQGRQVTPAPQPAQTDTDPLTGAVGRSAFERSIAGEVARARRYSHPLTVIVFRIDDLEDLYDQMGAATGDYILTAVGEVVSSNVRVSDLFARLGDNTFALILPETDLGGGKKVAEKLRRNVEVYPFDEVTRVTLSIGVTIAAQEDDGASLPARAESASRNASENGGNAVVVS